MRAPADATPATQATPRSGSHAVFRNRLRHGLVAGLVGLAAAWLLTLTGLTDAFEARSFDWRA
ncbi:MAG: hypothetical protein ACLGQH_05145, partial [Acidobacteriota bacterium]